MRTAGLALALCVALIGCQSHRTSFYSPNCGCGGAGPPPATARLHPIPQSPPPPIATLPAPPPEISDDPLRGGLRPRAKLGTPHIREESNKTPVPTPSPPPSPPEEDGPLPIDLPGYAAALPRVSSGLQPFPEGIDWLKKKGYKAALHVRPPGAEEAAARRQFEKRDINYLSLEVSPATLTKEKYEEFIQLVEDDKNLPLFVYDRDGSMIGGLWYLYFRYHKGETEEKAKTEAVRLGLRLDDEGDHKTVWIAVQTLGASLK